MGMIPPPPVIPAHAGIQSKANHADPTPAFELGCEGFVRIGRMDVVVRGTAVMFITSPSQSEGDAT